MAGLIGGYRSSILGTPWDWPSLAVSVAVTVLLFAAGLTYFRTVERRFADIA
jgi:lipopolysaccharide transport system permease protein